jgi:hypothetical protein
VRKEPNGPGCLRPPCPPSTSDSAACMLKYGQQHVDKGAEYYEQRNRQQQIEFLRKKAAQLGLRVTPTQA